MTILKELIDSREIVVGENARAEIPYVVSEAFSEDEVISFSESAIPENFRDLKRTDIRIGNNFNGFDSWFVTATYAKQELILINESKLSFDTTGGTRHITQSLQNISKKGPKASDLGGAIGYDGENVNGVDITVPVFNFSIEKTFPASVITDSYLDKIFRKTGKVNSGPFKSKQAGEVLFLGASGSESDDGQSFDVTFKFAASPNESSLTVGGIGGVSKKGWEYLWVMYDDEVDDAKKQIIKKPVAVYVEKVYESASFSSLGIGS